MWSITVAPVVVNPDMVSKKASATEVRYPPNKNGNIPNREKMTHENDTSRNTSRLPISLSCFREQIANRNPTQAVMIVENNKGMRSFSWYRRETPNESRRNNDSKQSRSPKIYNNMRIFSFIDSQYQFC